MAEKGQHPAVQPARPPFKFLRKGSGSHQFDKKISYITNPKGSSSSSAHSHSVYPSNHSETSSVLSDNVFRAPRDNEPLLSAEELDEVTSNHQSRRNLTSPVQIQMPKRTDLDSGRGSGNSPSSVYKTQTRPDSGYSEFDAVSPNRSEAQESEVTVASRIPEDAEITSEPIQGIAHEKTVVSLVPVDDDVATEDQSVAQHDFRNDTESFLQKEIDVDDIRSLSPRTRDIRAQVEKNVPGDRDSMTNLSDRTTTNSLSSFSSRISRPLPQHSGFNREAPVNGRDSDRVSSAIPSPTIDVLRPSTVASSSSLDARQYIAARDKPLHVAFPPNLLETQKRPSRDKIRASESTRHPVAIQTSDRMDDYSSDITSVSAIGRGPRASNARVDNKQDAQNSPVSIASSFDAEPATPYHPREQKQHAAKFSDERIRKILEKQLRDAIIHTDIARHNMQKQAHKMNLCIVSLDEASAKIQKEREFLEEQKEKHRVEVLRSLNQIKKDRDALIKREKELNKNIADNQSEAKEAIQKASISKAEMRTKLNEKESQIKELKLEIEKLKKSNERLDNIVKQKEKRMNSSLKSKDTIIERLTTELNAATKTTKRNGFTPRSRMDSSDISAIQKADPIVKPVSRRQVHFNDTTDTTIYLPEDTFSSNSTNSFREIKKWILKNTVNLPKKGVCYTYCCKESNADVLNEVGVFDLRHVNGRMCGAKLYQYSNSDCRFIYGPLEVYYYGHTRMIVTLHGLDVKIRCFQDEIEIIRPKNEISKYIYKTNKLIETKTRKDTGMYSLVFDGSRFPNVMERHGHSDRSFEEDRVVLRRGTINDMLEHVIIEQSGVRWKSHQINSTINEWDVYAHPTKRQVKIQVELGTGEPFSILFCPSYDWVYIRHLDVQNPANSEPCCDMGSATRRRERNLEYCSVGDIVKT